MIVRLKGDISGTRDGRPWPPRGSELDLPDVEAAALCQSGMAIPVPTDDVEHAVIDDAERRALTTDTGPGRRARK